MKISGAEAILRVMADHGTDVLFGYPGAANTPLFDALYSFHKIKNILVRQEQGAAHMANGYAKVTGKVGVCTATSGPGATNLITGIATAYADSVPIIAITGQVLTGLIGRDAFQEADITGATNPFTKHNYLVKDANDLPQILEDAYYIASTGRPGPVVIDIPMDVQLQMIEFQKPHAPVLPGYKPTYKGNDLQIKRVAEAIGSAKRPLILAGGGCVSGGAYESLRKFVDKTGIPVANTMMALGVLPTDHPLNLGMLGTHGKKAANRAAHSCDTLIVVGARIGDRTINNTELFAKRDMTIIHIDIDPAEIGKNLSATIPVVGNVGDILDKLCEFSYAVPFDTAWKDEILEIRQLPVEFEKQDGFVDPRLVVETVNRLTGGDAVVATEVGQNQIWASNQACIQNPNFFLTSGGLGTMGYGLPAAIGAKVGRPDKTVICYAGDGSFQMNLQEMATMCQWGIDVKIILFNNGRLGMVREYQKQHYSGRYYCVELSGNPDFVKLAGAYGIPAVRVSSDSDMEAAVKAALETEGSYLVEVLVDPMESTL